MKLKLSFSLLCIFLAASCLNTEAQNTNLSAFTIKSNYTGILNSSLVDTTGKYGSNSFEAAFEIPLYKHFFKNSENKTGFWDVSFQNNDAISSLNIDFLNRDIRLLNIGFGLRGLYFTGNKNCWLTRLNFSYQGDEHNIGLSTPRFSGTLLFNRIVNRGFTYHLGLAYRYSFGIASVLPVAGIKYQITEKWKLFLSVPFYTSIQYKVNNRLLLSAKIHPSGTMSYFSNNDKLFGCSQNTLMFRKRATTFSLDAKYKINSFLSVNGDIGREGSRKIYFSDIRTEINKEPHNYFTSAIRSAWFINIGFIIKLDKKRNPSPNNDEFIDYSDDGFEY
ncbi:MAG: DUF6268 family outer membrane beta-barrel protein [Bacteroidetes bacterium]|nr:DUF6268 family outer membrane beta-barrel protein [Bacteroidota bacterium]